MDKRVFVFGITMLVAGGVASWYLYQNEPAGRADMTDEEKTSFEHDLVLNLGIRNITSMITFLGGLITLISIGLNRRRKDSAGKTVTQKPTDI